MSRIDEINKAVAGLLDEKDTIQAQCSHPPLAVKKTAYRSGENDNEYWYACRCGLCGKYWNEQQ